LTCPLNAFILAVSMENKCLCPACSKYTEMEFNFCPYCAKPLYTQPAAPLAALAEQREDDRAFALVGGRIDGLESRFQQMQSRLEVFINTGESQK
jgi:predicted amidophosphoribosyltransferase